MADKKEVSSFNFKPSEELSTWVGLHDLNWLREFKIRFIWFKLQKYPSNLHMFHLGWPNSEEGSLWRKEAAKEANEVKKKQQYQQAKEGKPPLQY